MRESQAASVRRTWNNQLWVVQPTATLKVRPRQLTAYNVQLNGHSTVDDEELIQIRCTRPHRVNGQGDGLIFGEGTIKL